MWWSGFEVTKVMVLTSSSTIGYMSFWFGCESSWNLANSIITDDMSS